MESILNIDASTWHKSQVAPTGQTTLLEWFTSNQHEQQVLGIRNEQNEAVQKEMKLRLPMVSVGGIFQTTRTASNLITPSGFICLDIDMKGNEKIGNYNELKKHIANINEVACCMLSVRGNGYMVLVKVAQPDKHLNHWLALERAFKSFGITIDPACKDVTRVRFASYDTEAYFNHGAKVFTRLYEPQQARKVQHFAPTGNEAEKVENCLRQIERHGTDITGGYNDWFAIGCNFASLFGEGGRDYFHRASQFCKSYKPAETDNKFDDCLKANKQPHLGAFINRCKDFGLIVTGEKMPCTTPIIPQPVIVQPQPIEAEIEPIIEKIYTWQNMVNDAVRHYKRAYTIKTMNPEVYFKAYGQSVRQDLKGQTIQYFTESALKKLNQ